MTKTIEIKPTVSKSIYLTDFQYVTIDGVGIDQMTKINQFLTELSLDILSVRTDFSPKCIIDIKDNVFQIKLGVSYPFIYHDTIFFCDLAEPYFDSHHLGNALNKWQNCNQFFLFMEIDRINKLFKNVRLFEKAMGFQGKIIDLFKKKTLSAASIYNPFMLSFFEISYSFEDYAVLIEDTVNTDICITITSDDIVFKGYNSKNDFDLSNEDNFIEDITKHFLSFYPESMVEYADSLPEFIKIIEMQYY